VANQAGVSWAQVLGDFPVFSKQFFVSSHEWGMPEGANGAKTYTFGQEDSP
jgi:hypothetical protein